MRPSTPNRQSAVTRANALTHPNYRPDIDGLRAIAVVSVVGFHAFPNIARSGFIGVDIFFVISGFLISTIIFSNLDRNSFSFLDFYSRRIRRIFPALIAVLVVGLGAGWFILLADEYTQLGKHIAGGAVFVSNFVLWSESGYFDAAAETKPLLHLWSLGIEEQFYLLYPLIIWAALRIKVHRLAVISSIAAFSFAINIVQHESASVAAFYSPQTRFWELMLGALLADITLRGQTYPTFSSISYANLCSFLGLALLAGGFLYLSVESPFPGWGALLPTLGAMLLIHAGSDAWVNRTVLSRPLLVWIGLISYPLYLWHWIYLSIARIVLNHAPSLIVACALVVLSILSAWLTYVFVEKPIRFRWRDRRTTVLLTVLMAVVGMAGLITYMKDGFPERSIQQAAQHFEYRRHWQEWEDCSFVLALDASSGGCKILRKGAPVRLAVIGDSHAGHLATGLREYAHSRSLNAAVLLHAGCYPFYPVQTEANMHFGCPGNLISSALDFVIESQSVEVVMLSGYAALHLQENRFHEIGPSGESASKMNLQAFALGLDKTLSALTAAGKQVIVVTDVPELYRDPKSCVDRIGTFVSPDCSIHIRRSEVVQRNRDYYDILKAYSDRYPNVVFTNTLELFCDNVFCYGAKDDTLLYASRDHLTPAGSTFFIRGISGALDRFLP